MAILGENEKNSLGVCLRNELITMLKSAKGLDELTKVLPCHIFYVHSIIFKNFLGLSYNNECMYVLSRFRDTACKK